MICKSTDEPRGAQEMPEELRRAQETPEMSRRDQQALGRRSEHRRGQKIPRNPPPEFEPSKTL